MSEVIEHALHEAKVQAARDRARDAVMDAVGRVVARIEIFDEVRGTAALHELLERCRDLKLASDEFSAVVRGYSADSGSQE